MIVRDISGTRGQMLRHLEEQFGDQYLYAFNSFKAGEQWAFRVMKAALEHDKQIMSREMPLIGRADFNKELAKHDIPEYYRIGLNYVSSYVGHNYFIPDNTA